jgi:hypothetical protein
MSKKDILLLCNRAPLDATTISEHIDSFKSYSEHNVTTLSKEHFTSLSPEYCSNFDAIVVHYTLAITHNYYLSPAHRRIISGFAGVKVLFIQDEYRWIHETRKCMLALGVDVLFSCAEKPSIDFIYPNSLLPGLQKYTTLTGYVPESLLKKKSFKSYNEKAIDISYRGRKIPSWIGSLGLEKYWIAEQITLLIPKVAPTLKLDISTNANERMYGESWMNFLESSKAALGTESGASFFDQYGLATFAIDCYESSNPSSKYTDVKERYFNDYDETNRLNVISPRIFEYAASKTMMILFEGSYSGILKPWTHYLPLKKDFSNLEQIISILNTKSEWEKITDRAYNDIILNSLLTYKEFISNFDMVVEKSCINKLRFPVKNNILQRKTRRYSIQYCYLSSFIQLLKILKNFYGVVKRLFCKACRIVDNVFAKIVRSSCDFYTFLIHKAPTKKNCPPTRHRKSLLYKVKIELYNTYNTLYTNLTKLQHKNQLFLDNDSGIIFSCLSASNQCIAHMNNIVKATKTTQIDSSITMNNVQKCPICNFLND